MLKLCYRLEFSAFFLSFELTWAVVVLPMVLEEDGRRWACQREGTHLLSYL